MATIVIDTYQAVKELQEAGFKENQAAAMVSTMCSIMGGNLATKEDLAVLQLDMATKSEVAAVLREMAETRQEMATKDDIAAVRQEMAAKDDVAAVRREMDTKADKSDLSALETRMTLRIGGIVVGGIGLVLAILRLFPNLFG